MKIRYALPEDAEAIVAINVEGWQTAYRGIFPDDFLESLTKDVERTKQNILDKPHTDLVYENEKGEILGFCSFGDMRWEEYEDKCDCELYAIYVALCARRKGIGKALFQATLAEFKSQNKKGMLVNVLAENIPSVKFYQRLGSTVIGNKDFTLKDVNYPQLTLAFKV